jgi:hypothetical protein
MSEVVDTDSGPKIEIKIEETAIPGASAIPTPSLEGDEDVKYEDVERD